MPIYVDMVILLLFILTAQSIRIQMDKQHSYIDDYQYHALLGDGGQASVYLVSKNKQLFAAKVYFAGASKVDSFKREAEFLKKLNYKHLINVVGDNLEAKVKLPGKDETVRPVLYLEFAEGGQLFDYIAKEGRFPPEICRSLVKMLISSIQYLNSVGVTHRDLKPENILFDKNYSLKVSDFGLSTMLEGHDGDGILYTKLGTEGYKPPEMEMGKYTGIQADLFAAGVILFVMYVGTPPFISTKTTDKIYRLIRDKNYAKFWALHEKKKPQGFFPDSFKRLLNSFFSSEVEKRPTFESLNEDQWLNGDQAMQNDIYTEMFARYQRMLANDENKQKIELAKLEMYKTEMEEENCCQQQKQEKKKQKHSEMDEQDHRDAETKETTHFYKINQEQLPRSDKYQLISTKVAPSVLVAWLQNYLKEQFKAQNIFIRQTLFPTIPKKYTLKFKEDTNKIFLDLEFVTKDDLVSEEDDSEEDHETQESITLSGQLVQLEDGSIAIDWESGNGNAFWISSLVSDLNSKLRLLA